MKNKGILFLITAFLFSIAPSFAIETYDTVEAKELQRNSVAEKEEPVDDSFAIDFRKYKQKRDEKKAATLLAAESESNQSMDLTSDEMEYYNETNELEARGHVKIVTYPDKTILTADKMIYNQNQNTVKAYDNVTIYKDGAKLYGDYMLVNLNEENILMNEPTGEFQTVKITAQEGYAYSNHIEAINGDVELAKKVELALMTTNFGGYDQSIINKEAIDFDLKKKRSEPYKIKTKEIIITSGEEHNTITFKNADIYYKKFKLGTGGNIKVVSNKTKDYIETNLPEIGSLGGFGFYMGPGYVQNMPRGSVLKVAPIVVSGEDSFGVGGIAKFRSKTNYTEAAVRTGTEGANWIVRGKQKLLGSDDFYLEYARRGYMEEWFQGERRPGYLAQLVYHKDYMLPDFGKGTVYTQRFTGGYVSEYENEEFGTMRLRWQAQLNRPLWEISNKEQEMYLRLNGIAQVSATVYGTGETVGILRVGPSVESRVKNWGSRISYSLAGIHGLSPFYFDEYRYGRSSISVDESLRINKYVALGYYGVISPLRDNYEEELITENRFYVIAGPEDIKVAIGYDTVRSRSMFDVIFMLGSENSKIKFDKLKIKDPQTLKESRKVSDKEYMKVEEPI